MDDEEETLQLALAVADYIDIELTKDPAAFISVHRNIAEQAASFARAAAAMIEANRAGRRRH
jgi:hypothetical protein